jgi:hypothetical protein
MTAQAYPPLPGVYRSADLGGPLWTGGDFEGWAPGASLLSGSTVNLASVEHTADGFTLYGSQWVFRCVDGSGPPVLVADDVDGSGNGHRVYARPFNVSTSLVYLGWRAPWGGDAAHPLFGRLDSYADQVTTQYAGGVPVSTTLSAVGRFFDFPDYTVTLDVGQGVLLDTGRILDFDFFHNSGQYYLPGCIPGPTNGALWAVSAITITIDGPAVPARRESWGRIKSAYR